MGRPTGRRVMAVNSDPADSYARKRAKAKRIQAELDALGECKHSSHILVRCNKCNQRRALERQLERARYVGD